MTDLIGKEVECHNMPENSFFTAIKGKVIAVEGKQVTVRATEVMDRWCIVWKNHPTTSYLTSIRVDDIEIA